MLHTGSDYAQTQEGTSDDELSRYPLADKEPEFSIAAYGWIRAAWTAYRNKYMDRPEAAATKVGAHIRTEGGIRLIPWGEYGKHLQKSGRLVGPEFLGYSPIWMRSAQPSSTGIAKTRRGVANRIDSTLAEVSPATSDIESEHEIAPMRSERQPPKSKRVGTWSGKPEKKPASAKRWQRAKKKTSAPGRRPWDKKRDEPMADDAAAANRGSERQPTALPWAARVAIVHSCPGDGAPGAKINPPNGTKKTMIATAAKRSPPVFDEAAFVNRLRAYEKSPAGFTDALLDLARQQESNPRFVPNARPYMDTMGLPTDEMVKHLTRRNIDILAADTDAQGALRLSAEKISLHRTRVIICIGWALETAGRLVRI